MRFVLDASLTLAWCFKDEKTKFTAAVLEALPGLGAAVPTIWIHEVTNGLRTAQRASRITEEAVAEFVNGLGPLPIDTILLDPETMFGEVRLAALAHNLSAYDASYLVLAQKLHVPLATLDGTGKRMGLKQAAGEVACRFSRRTTSRPGRRTRAKTRSSEGAVALVRAADVIAIGARPTGGAMSCAATPPTAAARPAVRRRRVPA